MGHVVAFGIKLRRLSDGVVQDAEKLRCDLFAARHGCLYRGSRELSGGSFQLRYDLDCFHDWLSIVLWLEFGA